MPSTYKSLGKIHKKRSGKTKVKGQGAKKDMPPGKRGTQGSGIIPIIRGGGSATKYHQSDEIKVENPPKKGA